MSARAIVAAVAVALGLSTSACASFDYRSCDEPAPARQALLPPTLAGTGLYANASTGALATGVVRYRPRFPLWSDGETKERWIYLPPGSTIDTSDMDAWRFPRGTKLWKAFHRDGSLLETRFMEKVGDGDDDWVAVAYVGDGGDARARPEGTADVRGTRHDVPAASACQACHGGRASRVLGFSAIQLAGDGRPGDMTLGRLADEGRLSEIPRGSFDLPGDATARAALGYLHGNCSHCHNAHRPARVGRRCFDPETSFDLELRTDELDAVAHTAAHRTTVGTIVTPGAPDDSELMQRVEGTIPFAPRMPAFGSETVDAEGVKALRTWIAALR